MDLENKTVCQLKELAKERGISGFSNLRKPELISLIVTESNRSGTFRSPKKKYFVEHLSGNETVAELKKIAKSTKMRMIPNMNRKQLSMVNQTLQPLSRKKFPKSYDS